LAKFPEIKRIDGHKTTFSKKLEIIKKLGSFNHQSYTAIKAVNEIRNGIAHNLSGNEVKEGHKTAIYALIGKQHLSTVL
jgi:hypothetical protein